MPIPDTHLQKRLGGCGCAPDESILFGPGREETTSHFFTVGDKPVALICGSLSKAPRYR